MDIRMFPVILLLASCGWMQHAPAASDAQARGKTYSSRIVLFVGPDSTGIERLKEKFGEDDFYVVADDENYYRSEGFTLLDSLGIGYEVIERHPLCFVVDGAATEYAWTDVESAWFVVLYDADKAPRVSSSVDLPLHVDYFSDEKR